MPITIPNPYSGKDDETCSVSFAAQQSVVGGVSSEQTEAEYHKSRLLGEWGVIKAKLQKKEIPEGTKFLSYTNTNTGTRGYFYVGTYGSLQQKYFNTKGGSGTISASFNTIDLFVNTDHNKVSIPQSVTPKPKPEPVELTPGQISKLGNMSFPDGKVVAVNAAGDHISYSLSKDQFVYYEKAEYGFAEVTSSYDLTALVLNGKWYEPDGKASTPKSEPKTEAPPPTVSAPVAAPVPTPPVNPGSNSVGSMSDEDVSAMFVKIKDDVAKQLGVNVKGANPDLDALVYKGIAGKTGYTPEEVKGKIDAYKATGAKLSALKKKVMAGTYKVPEGKPPGDQKPQDTKASPAAPLNTPKATSKPVNDPQPNGVPTVATPKVADEAKKVVVDEVKAKPAKVYSAEDIAAQYIMRKDEIVGNSNGKWTLYTKSDELELEIAIQIGLKTGLNPLQQKEKLADYLGSGKKLSVLKKQLIKQGAFKPLADTLKSKGSTADPDKAKDVNAKADAGYTPTPTPSAGTPPTDTGKPAPKRVEKEAQESGDITGIADSTKALIYSQFKNYGAQSYLSSPEGTIYEGFIKLQAYAKQFGWGKDLTLLQLIRVVDDQGAKKFKADNAFLFEKKVATWLTTPAGAQYLKNQEKKLAEQAEKAKKEAELLAAAKKLEANQPPLPADSARYKVKSQSDMERIHAEQQRIAPWTASQRSALTKYTGSAYTQMNSHLRSGKPIEADTSIKNAAAGMRPSTEDLLLHRGTGLSQFGIENEAAIWGLTGKTLEDKGFMSTSFGGRAAFGGQVMLEVEVPMGSRLAYAKPISRYSSENEVILAPGTKYKVLRVETEGVGYSKKYIVRVRVVQ